jgi:hypothetical protein
MSTLRRRSRPRPAKGTIGFLAAHGPDRRINVDAKPSAIRHFAQGGTGGSKAGGVAVRTVGMSTFEQALRAEDTMTKMNLKIEHQVPGRVRMKIPAGKGNPELLKQISEVFGVIPGIEEVIVNPTTGSVVLHYDTDRHDEFHGSFKEHCDAHHAAHGVTNGASTGGLHGADTELDKLTHSIEEEAEFLARHSHTARLVVDFVKMCDSEIKRATNNNVDLKIVFAITIIGFTVFEVGATAATPVWVTLAIFTVNHFIEMHERQAHVEKLAELKVAPVRIKA